MYGKGSSKFLIYLGLRNQPVVFNLDHGILLRVRV